MTELTNEEYLAVKKFADGLKTCFKAKDLSSGSPISKACFNYVNNIIDLHLQLAELDFEYYVSKQKRTLTKV